MIDEYIKLRNEALEEFEKTGEIHKMKRIYKMYGMDVPEDSILTKGMKEAISEGRKCITR